MLKTRLNKGITLIELLVGLAVLVILTVLAVPTFLQVFQEYSLNTKTTNLYYMLQYARSAAIKNNQSVYVNFNTGSSWCYGVNAGSTCNCSTANSCTLNTTTANNTSLTLSATGLTSNTLIFDGTHGSASIATITFTITSGTSSMAVSVGALGNMRVCSNNVSGYPTCP